MEVELAQSIKAGDQVDLESRAKAKSSYVVTVAKQ